MNFVRLVIVLAVIAAPAAVAAQSGTAGAEHTSHVAATQSAFVERVRRATDIYRDVRNASPEYQRILGCVSGPQEGAMGVHFLNGAIAFDNELNPDKPEALIYELDGDTARLVGVEFLVLADVWHATHAPTDPPVLEGQLLQFVETPNRFGLPAFYELHVWAWRDNPHGMFVDWNTRVSCDGQ